MAAASSGQPYEPDLMATSIGDSTEIYIPGLTDPSAFVTLPMVSTHKRGLFALDRANLGLIDQTDGIAALLDKYLPPNQRPPRDLTGNYEGKQLNELIVSKS
jgi:hypothetical protein